MGCLPAYLFVVRYDFPVARVAPPSSRHRHQGFLLTRTTGTALGSMLPTSNGISRLPPRTTPRLPTAAGSRPRAWVSGSARSYAKESRRRSSPPLRTRIPPRSASESGSPSSCTARRSSDAFRPRSPSVPVSPKTRPLSRRRRAPRVALFCSLPTLPPGRSRL